MNAKASKHERTQANGKTSVCKLGICVPAQGEAEEGGDGVRRARSTRYARESSGRPKAKVRKRKVRVGWGWA